MKVRIKEWVDNGERYSQRLCLRMYYFDLQERKNIDGKVEKVLRELDFGVTVNAVD